MLRKLKIIVLKARLIKLLLMALAVMMPTVTLLAGGPHVLSHHSLKRNPSFYVDTGIGVDVFSSPSANLISGSVAAGQPTSLQQAGRLANQSTAATLGFGYVFPLNNWFNLGLRAFVNYDNNFDAFDGQLDFNTRLQTTDDDTKAKLRNWEYGIDLVPNINLGANQFVSFILGLAFNEATISASGEVQNSGGAFRTIVETSSRRNITGTRVGFGLEELLSRYFSLYMNYIWTGYGSSSFLQLGNFSFRSISDINLQKHNILMGLKYYFSPQNYQTDLRAIANHFNRLYLRLAVGALVPFYSSSGDMHDNETALSLQYHNNMNQGAPGVLGILGLGYGVLIHHFYIGAEAMMNVANRDSRSEFNYIDAARTTEKRVGLKLNTVEGAFDLKLGGIIVQQTLLVGRVGLAINDYRLQHLVTVYNTSAGFTPTRINQFASHVVVGLRFGLGLEKLFSDNFGLSMNYIYTYYGHGRASATARNAAVVLVSNIDSRASTHGVSIGVNYYFS